MNKSIKKLTHSSPGTKLSANFAVPPLFFSQPHQRAQQNRLETLNGQLRGELRQAMGERACSRWPSLSGACDLCTFPLQRLYLCLPLNYARFLANCLASVFLVSLLPHAGGEKDEFGLGRAAPGPTQTRPFLLLHGATG